MSPADEIEKLSELRKKGDITEEEFQKGKESILKKNQSAGEKINDAFDGIASDVNTWAMFIHLSQLCGFLLPIAGFIVPIILWQIKKDDSPVIDKHGKIVANWLISAMIYGVVCGILAVTIILSIVAAPAGLALSVVSVIFPIVGGLKAKDGQFWPYPLSITFFHLDSNDVDAIAK